MASKPHAQSASPSRCCSDKRESKAIFMAEGGAIFNPDKQVYIASHDAICPMARMAPKNLIIEAKKANPDLPVMMYINTTAEARAQADYICTSANCLKIAKAIGKKNIYFSPDQNLGYYIQNNTGIKLNILPEDGCCEVHHAFEAKYIKQIQADSYVNCRLFYILWFTKSI